MENKVLNWIVLFAMIFGECVEMARCKEPLKLSVSAYKIAGTCEKIDISSNSDEYSESYFDFAVKKDFKNIKSKMEACPASKLKDLAEFSRKDAEAKVALGEDEHVFWSIDKIKSLKPKSCGIIRNPGANNSVVIIKYVVNAVRGENITGNTLLAILRADLTVAPKQTLAQFIGNKSIYEIKREVNVRSICDLDSDGLVEIILVDDRYAGSNFWVEKFADDLSTVNSDSVDSFRGD